MSGPSASSDERDLTASVARRVLVVDDDEGLNGLVQKTLRRSGFETQGVLTGAEALARVAADPELTLLLDQQLPDMSGTALVRMLHDKGRRAPFVAMTGHGDERTAVEMMKLGARDYLVKGFNLMDLLPEVFLRLFRELETEKRLRQATKRLRESEERFKLAMEANQDGLWDRNIDSGETYYSPNYTAMLGYDPQATGLDVRLWENLIHPEDRGAARDAYGGCVEGRHDDLKTEFRMLASNGEWRWILRRGKVVARDGDGRAVRMVGTHSDVTERKQAEALILEMRDKAEAANRAKSEFLANMSHEIRTPLNGVLGMLQLLETTSPTPEQDEFLQAAMQATRRLTQLLVDILDISRIEAGKMRIIDDEFQTGSLLGSIEDLFGRAAKEKGLRLTFSIDERTPKKLIGDEVRLRQILFNLVGNAVKFTSQGEVRLEIVPVFHADESRIRLLFTVSDTGVGIPDSLLKHIFEPFVQAEGSYTRRFQGAGLGLSIVKKLVALMHGEIAIDSSPGEGTTVYISMPFRLSSLPGPRVEQPAAAAPPSGAKIRILFAEDDRINMLTGKRMLEKSGYCVVTAKDGQEAIQLLSEQDYDLVLMDIQMPVMDGVEATRIIRSSAGLGNKSSIPVIAMTAYAMSGDREKFLAAGMNEYIAKPVNRTELVEVIERVLSRSPAVSGNR